MTKKNELQTDVWSPRELEIAGVKATSLVSTQFEAPVEEVVGTQNIDTSDLVLPELKLCQSMSDEVQEGIAKAGQYVLSTTNEVFDPPLQVLVVFHSKGRCLFPKDAAGSGHLEVCLSKDALTGTTYGDCADCAHKEWPTEAQKTQQWKSPHCSEQNNFVVLLPQGPAVIRFARTSFKNSKKFLSAFNFSRKNLWHYVAVLRTKPETKVMGSKQATYYTHRLDWDGKDPLPESLRKAARETFDLLEEMDSASKLDLAGEFEES